MRGPPPASLSLWKRPLTGPSFDFRPVGVALSPHAGRGAPSLSAPPLSVSAVNQCPLELNATSDIGLTLRPDTMLAVVA